MAGLIGITSNTVILTYGQLGKQMKVYVLNGAEIFG